MKKTMKIATTSLLLTSVGASVVVPSAALADTETQWSERSLDEISQDVSVQEGGVRYYKVQWGDTLSTIARALRMDLDELIRINNISNPDFILVDTILVFDATNHILTEIDEAGEEVVYSTETGEIVDNTMNYETSVQEERVFTPAVALALPVVEQEETTVEQDVELMVPQVEEFVVANQEEQEETVFNHLEEPATMNIAEETTDEESDLLEVAEDSIQPVVRQETESTVEEEVAPLEVEEVVVPEVAVVEETVEVETVAPQATAPAPTVDTSNMSAREAFDSLAQAKGLTQAEIDGWAYIIERESNWDPQATNPTSGAYGLAQNIDPSRYSSHGDDWATNPHTQLEWMYDYMAERYGSIQGALDFWNQNHWY